jgi:hypothetical protein
MTESNEINLFLGHKTNLGTCIRTETTQNMFSETTEPQYKS